LAAELIGKKKKGGRFPGRKMLWKALAAVLFAQLLAFAFTAATLYYIEHLAMAKDFYSAHRSLSSAQLSVLPTVAFAAAAGFLVAAVSTWLGFRHCLQRLSVPLNRAAAILQRLARGKLSYSEETRPGRERWALDDSADAVMAAFSERVNDMQRSSRDIHNNVLALRYKATAAEPLTIKELQEATGEMDSLCKQLNAALKWFES